LHTDELTYSVTGPPDEPQLTGGVLESYRRLSQALLEALLILGLPAEALPKTPGLDSNPHSKEPVCFEVPSNYEITVHGKKLIGSAQARRKHGVLQHGTLPLFGDLTRITKVLSFPNEQQRNKAAERLLQRATTIENAINRTICWEEAAEAVTLAFENRLNIQLRISELSSEELSQAEKLVKEKYAHPNWTERI
jgi:lipoate-protein ligase A